ncbi:MAG: ABC transporter permease, partial [Lachnospiraceae bacterium]|nr:ABC transporter permease [Lachnospiraceae bacterium]
MQKSLLSLIIAMFMGCVFNAMNMISEKEEGIIFINEVLPMTKRQYIFQKIFIGFILGCLSSVLTVCFSLRLSIKYILPLLVLIVLSSFISALVGML